MSLCRVDKLFGGQWGQFLSEQMATISACEFYWKKKEVAKLELIPRGDIDSSDEKEAIVQTIKNKECALTPAFVARSVAHTSASTKKRIASNSFI